MISASWQVLKNILNTKTKEAVTGMAKSKPNMPKRLAPMIRHKKLEKLLRPTLWHVLPDSSETTANQE